MSKDKLYFITDFEGSDEDLKKIETFLIETLEIHLVKNFQEDLKEDEKSITKILSDMKKILEKKDMTMLAIDEISYKEIYYHIIQKYKIRFLNLVVIKNPLIDAIVERKNDRIFFVPCEEYKYIIREFFDKLIDLVFLKTLKGETDSIRKEIITIRNDALDKLRQVKDMYTKKWRCNKEKLQKIKEKIKQKDRDRGDKKEIHYTVFRSWYYLCKILQKRKEPQQQDIAKINNISDSFVSNILKEIYEILEEVESIYSQNEEYSGYEIFKYLNKWLIENKFEI